MRGVALLVAMAVALVAVAVALVLMIKVTRRSESFVDKPNEVLEVVGDKMIDSACHVSSAGGGTYAMRAFPSLESHPGGLANTCVFRVAHDAPTVMDSELSQCKADGFLGGAGVVEKVAPEDVRGEQQCVVHLKPGLATSAYAAYEKNAQRGTVKRTVPFISLQAQYDAAAAELKAAQAELARLSRELQMKQEKRRAAEAALQKAATRFNAAQSENQELTQRRAESAGILARRQQERAQMCASSQQRSQVAREAEAAAAAALAEVNSLTEADRKGREEKIRLDNESVEIERALPRLQIQSNHLKKIAGIRGGRI